MREEILLSDCPQVLQDRVKKVLEETSSEIFFVQKWEYTPFKDKTIVMTDYRVFMQHGYEVGIYKSYVTTGGGPLDGDVYSSSVNMAELEVIATKSRWIGEDLKRLLAPPDER
ncbi:hypothetical protein D3C75_461930 [compost metagenome]